MPHDAQTYADGVKQWTSPADTVAANAADVAAAQVEYESSEDSSEEQFRTVTGVGGVPTIASITPETGLTDTEITLVGSVFLPTSVVKAGATALVTTYVDAITLTAVVTGDAGVVDITVDNGNGDVSNVKEFTITPPAVAQATKKAAAKK